MEASNAIIALYGRGGGRQTSKETGIGPFLTNSILIFSSEQAP